MKERGIFLKRFRKVLIVLLAILVPVSIGFGFNFFSGESSDSAENQAMTVAGTLTVNEIKSAQNLVPGDKICKGVTMDITSSAVSLLRVKVDVYYAKVGSTEYTVTTDIAPIDNPGTNWLKGSDGYYYYKKVLKQGQGLENGLISRVKFKPNNSEAVDFCDKKVQIAVKVESRQNEF